MEGDVAGGVGGDVVGPDVVVAVEVEIEVRFKGESCRRVGIDLSLPTDK